MKKLLSFTHKTALLLVLLAGLGACGQKGPLIVEQTDPFATDALQDEAGEFQDGPAEGEQAE